jgi:hypothetical protein
VRLGFFMQFSFYVLIASSFPIKIEQLKANDGRRAWTETRFGIPFSEFPELKTQVVELVPKYAEELKQLLERVEGSL